MCRLGGRKVVVRLAFGPDQWPHVTDEVNALTALQDIQGANVPRLLQHSHTQEGFAYVMIKHMEVGSMLGHAHLHHLRTLHCPNRILLMSHAVRCPVSLSLTLVQCATWKQPAFHPSVRHHARSSRLGHEAMAALERSSHVWHPRQTNGAACLVGAAANLTSSTCLVSAC